MSDSRLDDAVLSELDRFTWTDLRVDTPGIVNGRWRPDRTRGPLTARRWGANVAAPSESRSTLQREAAMTTDAMPPRQDATDEAIHDLLEYLILTETVEGELNTVLKALRRVILALVVAEEAAGGLTPYRRSLLDQMRA
jgi:hypothetical protein